MKTLLIAADEAALYPYFDLLGVLNARGVVTHVAVQDGVPGKAFDSRTRRMRRVTGGPAPTPQAGSVRMRAAVLRRQREALAQPPATGQHRLPGIGRIRGRLAWALAALERDLPADPALVEWIRAQAPDTVLLASLFDRQAGQEDFLRAARAAGIGTLGLTARWNDVLDGGRLAETPDALAVWNAAHRRDAVRVSGQPAQRIVVLGAPGVSGGASAVGDPPPSANGRPLIVVEAPRRVGRLKPISVLQAWLTALRGRDESPLREAEVRVRVSAEDRGWRKLNLEGFGAVVIEPVSSTPRPPAPDLYRRAAAVVTFDMTGVLEAAAAGTPVLAWRTRDLQQIQIELGRFHARYGKAVALPHVSKSLGDHLDALAGVVAAPADMRRAQAFVLPHGVSMTPEWLIAWRVLAEVKNSRMVTARARPAALLRHLAGPLERIARRLAPPALPGLAEPS